MALQFERSWCDEDLERYRASVARFIEAEMLPEDAAARARGHVGHALWRRAGALGFLCADIPERYGGGGGDFRHEAVFYEEMARRGLSGMSTSVHAIVAPYFLNYGTEEQKERYLPKLARGELVGAIAMSEPGAGSDLQGVKARAVRQGDHYLLNGSKTFITNGWHADLVIVVAKTDPAQGAKGTSLIWSTPRLPGLPSGKRLNKMGLKAQDTSELFFDDVRVPADNLLGGAEDHGFIYLMERPALGAPADRVGALAGRKAPIAATLDYVRERKAFGKPSPTFQNTRFKLAELATEAQVARVFVDQCIELLLAGKLDTATASMAKYWCSDPQCKVIDECLQLHGGYGYMWEYPIARAYADARVQRIYGGTNEIMKEVISRSL